MLMGRAKGDAHSVNADDARSSRPDHLHFGAADESHVGQSLRVDRRSYHRLNRLDLAGLELRQRSLHGFENQPRRGPRSTRPR